MFFSMPNDRDPRPPGFVDIHGHFLPGLDDGPATLEMAAHMCQAARLSGTAAVISTPHANSRFAFDPARTARARAELQERVGGSFRVFSGSEVELSLDILPDALRSPASYTLNGSRYLLVELMTGGMAPHLDRVFARILDQGLVPVVAHPERNAHLQSHPARLRSWIERGCLAQLTAGALTGGFGRRVGSIALEWIRLNLVHFVASDAHDPFRRPPRLLDAYLAVQRTFSPARADLLFIHNPLAVLDDRPLRLGAGSE